jgi:hypothetical protein
MSKTLRLWTVALVMLAVLAIFALLIAARSLSQYPVQQTAELRRQLAAAQDLEFETRIQLEAALLQFETDNRIKIVTAVVQGAGGAVLLVGLLFTALNLRATQEKLDIDRQGQLTNRFIQATGQLGAELKGGQPNIEVRLGGIYALDRIANDWPKDYWPIANVLTAYVRHNARWSSSSGDVHEPKPTTDVQAILTILGHHDPPGGFDDRHKFDLRNTDLRGAEFWDARLECTDFFGAHLEGAQFWGADLRHAKLEEAHLCGANLFAAKLEGASLRGADVAGAIFDRDTVWPAGFDARGRGALFTEERADVHRADPRR